MAKLKGGVIELLLGVLHLVLPHRLCTSMALSVIHWRGDSPLTDYALGGGGEVILKKPREISWQQKESICGGNVEEEKNV